MIQVNQTERHTLKIFFNMECPLRFFKPITNNPSKVIFVLINTAVMMSSVLGNGIVMFVIITRQRLHQPTYYLIFSLALSDFIIALIGQSTYTIKTASDKSTSCIENKIIWLRDKLLGHYFPIVSKAELYFIFRSDTNTEARG